MSPFLLLYLSLSVFVCVIASFLLLHPCLRRLIRMQELRTCP